MITDSGLSVNEIRVKKQIESLVVFQRELLHLTRYPQFPGYFKNHLHTMTSSITLSERTLAVSKVLNTDFLISVIGFVSW